MIARHATYKNMKYQGKDQDGHQRLGSFFVEEFQMPPVAIPIVT